MTLALLIMIKLRMQSANRQLAVAMITMSLQLIVDRQLAVAMITMSLQLIVDRQLAVAMITMSLQLIVDRQLAVAMTIIRIHQLAVTMTIIRIHQPVVAMIIVMITIMGLMMTNLQTGVKAPIPKTIRNLSYRSRNLLCLSIM